MAYLTVSDVNHVLVQTTDKQSYLPLGQIRSINAEKMLQKYLKGKTEEVINILNTNPHFLFYTGFHNRNILHYAIYKCDTEFILFLLQFSQEVLSFEMYNKWIRMKAYGNSYYSYPIKIYNFEIISVLLRYIPLNDYIVIDIITTTNFDYAKTLDLLKYINDFVKAQNTTIGNKLIKESVLNCVGVYTGLTKRLVYIYSEPDLSASLYKNFQDKSYNILVDRKFVVYNPENYFVFPNLLNCNNMCNIYDYDLSELLDLLTKNICNFDLGTKYNNDYLISEPLGWLQYILSNISKTKILSSYQNYEIYLKKNLAKIYYLYFFEKINSKKLMTLLQIDFKLSKLKESIFSFYSEYPKFIRESLSIRDPLSILTYSYLEILPFLEYLKHEQRIKKIFNYEFVLFNILEFL
jgi:hypothetical protein